ncbi:hypothetical protein VP1G_10718 [Cytospora mali]|uniref:Uncharacterized protein n=1 Tax=Cytospora mali TaxID=578113 RepID=A0A194UTJ6_CYTMA|nr:hypothetical protein VP1G_10718 [Valsa mali var. pyri (nom. inval.)]
MAMFSDIHPTYSITRDSKQQMILTLKMHVTQDESARATDSMPLPRDWFDFQVPSARRPSCLGDMQEEKQKDLIVL